MTVSITSRRRTALGAVRALPAACLLFLVLSGQSGSALAQTAAAEAESAPSSQAQPSERKAPGGFGIDTNQPIEISADSFEVDTRRQVGTFMGSVRVEQAEITLLSETIRAHYATGSDQKAAGGQSIRLLEAGGGVRILSRKEQAEGEWARYDVPAEVITMGGGVVLKQDRNLLEGDQLTINLATGETRLAPGRSAVAADNGALPPKGGRVTAVFVPPSASSADEGEEEKDDTKTPQEAPN